jgi:hypothetical protein
MGSHQQLRLSTPYIRLLNSLQIGIKISFDKPIQITPKELQFETLTKKSHS